MSETDQGDLGVPVRIVGRYELLREIGRGGMAVVYVARQPDLDRQVALKELSRFHAGSAEFAHRFLRESRLAGSLNHPNVVTVHEYFEHDTTPYIAMEYVPRGSLRRYMRQLSLAQIAGVLEGVLAGLAHAETAQIVHRDLKPENIMVTADGRIKITDFGIARATQRAGTQFLTATGMTVGTPTYMAPEQAMAGEIGSWTDLYSVGVLAHELLVGQPPFADSDTPVVILMRQVNERIPSLIEMRPDIDPGLSAWVDSLLVKDPAERVRHALTAWESLEEIVVRLLGPLWRRDARLLEDRLARSEAHPLTPAPFESQSVRATPTPESVPVFDEFVTYEPGAVAAPPPPPTPTPTPTAPSHDGEPPAPGTPPATPALIASSLPDTPVMASAPPEAAAPPEPAGHVEESPTPLVQRAPAAPADEQSAEPADEEKSAEPGFVTYNPVGAPAPLRPAKPTAPEPPREESTSRPGGPDDEPAGAAELTPEQLEAPTEPQPDVAVPKWEADPPVRDGSVQHREPGLSDPEADARAPVPRDTPPAPEPPAGPGAARPATSVTARGGRRAPIAIMAALVAVAAAAIGFVVAPSSGGSAPSRPTALTQHATSGRFTLSYPSGWRHSSAVMSAAGSLKLTDPVTLTAGASDTTGALMFGAGTASAPTLLPTTFASTIQGSPQGANVKLGTWTFLRYLDLTSGASPSQVSVYALPTTAGTLYVACLVPQAEVTQFAVTCERVISSVTTSATELPLRASPAYATALSTIIAKLNAAQATAGHDLAVARNPRAQSAAASALGQAAERAAAAAARLTAGPGTATAAGALIAALRRLQNSYQGLSRAAAKHDKRAYAAAHRSITQAQSALDSAFAKLRQAGYTVS